MSGERDPTPVIPLPVGTPLFSDPTCPRTMEQTAARYNEEMAQNAVAARMQFIQHQGMAFQNMHLQQANIARSSFLTELKAIKSVLKDS